MNKYAEERCEICGEKFQPRDQVAEMYDLDTDEGSVICHAECGLGRGYEVA